MSSGRPLLFFLGGLLFLLLLRAGLGFRPDPALEDFRKAPYSLRLTDRQGRHLFTVPVEDGLIRLRIPSGELPSGVLPSDGLPRQVLANEDRWFYLHPGVNPLAVLNALAENLASRRIVRGGSTVTMQLASLIRPRPNSPLGKIQEAADALLLESKLTKGEILRLYLERVPFGRNRQGYEAAARLWFGRGTAELTPAEIQVLAGIPRNPARNDPFRRPNQARETALRNSSALPTEDQISRAVQQAAARRNLPEHPVRAPHFVQFVRTRLTPEDYRRGRDIRTTLDLAAQDYAESYLAQSLDNARENRISQAALLLLRRREITAYVGSRNFFEARQEGQIDGVQIRRQPGSTLKPHLYALALEEGMTPATVLPDIPMTFGGRAVYRPENYSQTHHGPVRLRTALASSLNIPAVYTLEQLGVSRFTERLKALGFDSLEGQEEDVGVGLAVGNAEVSLFELVRAFGVFRDGGRLIPVRWRLPAAADRPADAETPAPVHPPDPAEPIVPPSAAAVIQDILSDPRARILGFGRRNVMNTDYPAYFKTGTSNQFNNIWALGASADMTCGVWMGNFRGETVVGRPGSSLPAEAAAAVLEEFSSREPLPPLPDMDTARICPLSGGRVTPACPRGIREYFPFGRIPDPCSYHREDGRILLPPRYRSWLDLYQYDRYSTEILPAASADNRTVISSPQDGAVYYISPGLSREEQGVEFEILGRGSFTIRRASPQNGGSDGRNGSLLLQGSLPFHQVIFLEPGKYRLEFFLPDREETRIIEVRK